MRYIVPFSRIKMFLKLPAEINAPVTLRLDHMVDVIRHIIMSIPVDEPWYLEAYPDVARSVSRRTFFHSAKHHFIGSGYFEGRRPFEQETDEQRYPLSFAAAKTMLTVSPQRGGLMVETTPASFMALMRRLLVAVPVDEDWYRATYKDVAKAIDAGRFDSASEHFWQSGYFDGRWPYEIPLDEAWYLDSNPDVSKAHAEHPGFSTLQHFRQSGYKEGRRPGPETLQYVTGVV